MPISIEQVLLAVLLVVPGYIAITVSRTIGVVGQDQSETRLVINSIVASACIDSAFYVIASSCFGASISGIQELSSVFFTPQFRGDYVLLLLGLSLVGGGVLGTTFVLDLPDRFRRLVWSVFGPGNWKSTPFEPWDNALRNAALVRVGLANDELIAGKLSEFGDQNEPKQLVLEDPELYRDDEYKPTAAEKIILLEEDIERVEIIRTDGNYGKAKSDTDH